MAKIYATCTYDISRQLYDDVVWKINRSQLYLVIKIKCTDFCGAPPYAPTYSDVPGNKPNLYMDPSIPLTQYITRRTYKGTYQATTGNIDNTSIFNIADDDDNDN